MKQEIVEKIRQMIPDERVREQELLSHHTTFRVGGPAFLFVEIQSQTEAQELLLLLNELGEDYYLIGNGSNLLVSDSGFDGIMLHLGKEFSRIEVQGNKIICEAGATLAQVANKAYQAGLSGFEFAAGIPGTIGGAIVMNAGAYGGEMKQVVTKVKLLDACGNLVEKTCEEMHFSYRHSLIKEQKCMVLGVEIELIAGNKEEIKAQMDQLNQQRREKQPLEYPSAGSTFKRPEGYFAGKLIEDTGLRGYQYGGAQVSEKHCGFVINRDHASAAEIYQLIQNVSEKVDEKFHVRLEPEVIMVGDFATDK